MTLMETRKQAADELGRMIGSARVPRVRSMRQFAEDEIVLPDGPYQDYRLRVHRQPFTGLLLDEIDSGRWPRVIVTGDVQSGKSLFGFNLAMLYHLFELNQTVVMGVYNEDMADDKWQNSLLPIIKRTRYADLLPKRGGGARGGKTLKVVFENGATLRIMTAGGNDKKRAAFTTRVVAATEIDGMDTSGGSSREADKLSQIEARTAAYGDRARVYYECTVTTKEGRTWREYEGSSQGRIVVQCPHCDGWVTPEREHLRGWNEADDESEAREKGHFVCPACEEKIDEDMRKQMNQNPKLIHKGQDIDMQGNITGDPPKVSTLGFRWNCFNNNFKPIARIAAKEYIASLDPDEENAEKEMCQFWWAKPYEAPHLSIQAKTVAGIASRQRRIHRGLVPEKAECLTVGIDLGQYLSYWIVTAWLPDGSPHVVDYGYIEVPSDDFAVEVALPAALRQFRDDRLKAGWLRSNTDDDYVVPQLVVVDAGNWQDIALDFAAESTGIVGSKGRGAGQYGSTKYVAPQRRTTNITMIGERYHMASIVSRSKKRTLLHVDVDYWKRWVHLRLEAEIGKIGALSLFMVEKQREHYTLAKHILAEEWSDEFQKWIVKNRSNHFFDALTLSFVGGHICGVRISQDASKELAKGRASGEKRKIASKRNREARPDRWKPQPLGTKL